jgi:hypothetical protein
MAIDLLSVIHRQADYSFFGLWQRTSFGFFTDIFLTICSQRAEMKW